MRSLSGVSVALLLVVIASSPARAQTSRIGPSITAISDVVRGSSVAYDYKDSIYFVVSAHGNLNGRLISADGALLGAVQIQPASAGVQPVSLASPTAPMLLAAGGFLCHGINRWRSAQWSTPAWSQRLARSGPEPISSDGSCGKPVRISPIRPQAKNSSSSGRHTGYCAQRIGNGSEMLGANIYVTAPITIAAFRRLHNSATNEFMVVAQGADSVSAYAAARRRLPDPARLVGAETC
jgi:hypothetical protein